jgi:signal transduction histidine kinase
MRERAAELGGTLEIAAGAVGGTRVRAWLPLAEADPG